MKKRGLTLLLIAALALGLCACAHPAENESQQPSAPSPGGESTVAPTETPAESADPSTVAPTEAPTDQPSAEVSAPSIVMPGASATQEPADDTVLPPSGVGEGDQDLHIFMDELFPAVYEFPALELMSDERMVQEYPGLGAIPVKQRLIYTPMMSGVACEFAFVEVENEADADAVNAIFQQRIQTQVDGGAFYPAMIEQWENNANIYTSGKYVFLAVHEMSSYMVSDGGDFDLALGLG